MKIFAHSLAVVLLAGTAFAAAPVMAKDAKPAKVEAAKPAKLSKPYSVGLSAAQKQLQAGDNAGALTTLNGLDAVPPTEADDAYTTMLMKLNAAIGLKDNLLTEKMLQGLLDTGRVSATDQPKFLRNIGSLALNRKDYNTATGAQINATNAPTLPNWDSSHFYSPLQWEDATHYLVSARDGTNLAILRCSTTGACERAVTSTIRAGVTKIVT